MYGPDVAAGLIEFRGAESNLSMMSDQDFPPDNLLPLAILARHCSESSQEFTPMTGTKHVPARFRQDGVGTPMCIRRSHASTAAVALVATVVCFADAGRGDAGAHHTRLGAFDVMTIDWTMKGDRLPLSWLRPTIVKTTVVRKHFVASEQGDERVLPLVDCEPLVSPLADDIVSRRARDCST
jgi:hypothetical protein